MVKEDEIGQSAAEKPTGAKAPTASGSTTMASSAIGNSVPETGIPSFLVKEGEDIVCSTMKVVAGAIAYRLALAKQVDIKLMAMS